MCKDEMKKLLKAHGFRFRDEWYINGHRDSHIRFNGVYVADCVVKEDKVRLKATEVRFSKGGIETRPINLYFYYRQWNASEEENLFLDIQNTNIISKSRFLELIKPYKDSYNEYKTQIPQNLT
jgi:hypothetical protein